MSLQSSFPLARKSDQYFVDYLWELGDSPPWQSLTPYCSPSAKPMAQSVVLQGLRKEDLKGYVSLCVVFVLFFMCGHVIHIIFRSLNVLG